MIVALVGMPSSGKGEASKIFEENGFSVVRMRNAVMKELEQQEMAETTENVGKVAVQLREREGPEAVAIRTLPAVLDAGDKVCIEGVRSGPEINFFRDSLDDFVVVGVDAPAEKRYGWAVERGRPDDVQSFEEFQAKDEREAGWGITEAVQGADYVIMNSGTLQEFQGKVREVLEKIDGE